tara:strand:+ start:204 stop:449 length:246 start_codon:yes stop_codon:yes gene_type:complete
MERTVDEIATIFKNAGNCVEIINTDKAANQTDDEYKDRIRRNVEHLEIIKTFKKVDNTTSIWTNEDFTAINAAITSGKSKY